MWNPPIKKQQQQKTVNRPNETCESNSTCRPLFCNISIRWSLKPRPPRSFTSCPVLCAVPLGRQPWSLPLPSPGRLSLHWIREGPGSWLMQYLSAVSWTRICLLFYLLHFTVCPEQDTWRTQQGITRTFRTLWNLRCSLFNGEYKVWGFNCLLSTYSGPGIVLMLACMASCRQACALLAPFYR